MQRPWGWRVFLGAGAGVGGRKLQNWKLEKRKGRWELDPGQVTSVDGCLPRGPHSVVGPVITLIVPGGRDTCNSR